MKQDYLVLEKLTKVFGSGKNTITAVDKVNLQVKKGELITLLGPSGCGKTTTLRMIAGFEFPTSGKIFIEDKEISLIPPNKTEKIISLVGLEGLSERSPAHLSGGQQQRVSLARSLIMEPKVLLLDEPLSNLDAKLRVSTRLEIRKLQQRVGITSVYVTHDQEEAMTLSDRVVIMNAGKIQQIGTPQEIYAHPVNYFVADFIGKANFLEGRVEDVISKDKVLVEVKNKKYEVFLIIRPESVELEAKKPNTLTGIVRQLIYLGSRMIYEIKIDKDHLTVEITNPQEHKAFSSGEEVSINFQKKSLHIIPYEEIKK